MVGHLGTKQPSLPGAFMQRSGASPLLSCVHINDSVVVWASMQRCGPLPSKRMYDDILFDTSEHSYFGAKLSVTSTIHYRRKGLIALATEKKNVHFSL